MQGSNNNPALLSDALKGIARQAMRAGNIIRQLRAFVQKDSPQMMLADLNTLINEIIVLMKPNLKRQGVELRLELAEQLPPVVVSGIEIQQVLVNLIQNAVDAMQGSPRGFRKLAVSTRLTEQAAIAVTVADTGPGMNKQTLEQVFTPFFTTKDNECLGVGLSISYSIIEAHGGTLAVKSLPDSGTCFSFILESADHADLSSLI
jgi:two-component system sensor histidine kinase TtrS